jgi:hypothetical protein
LLLCVRNRACDVLELAGFILAFSQKLIVGAPSLCPYREAIYRNATFYCEFWDAPTWVCALEFVYRRNAQWWDCWVRGGLWFLLDLPLL